MMHLYLDEPATVFLTLSELTTIAQPFYLFVFERRVASDAPVAVVLQPTLSNERFDQFEIDSATLFAGQDPGQWTYKVYEQDGGQNLDPLSSGAMIESGTMDLHPLSPFKYAQPVNKTSFIQS